MNITIAQQLNVKEFPFIIRDKNGNKIYFEKSTGYWVKSEFDSNGNKIYCEDSNGYWSKFEYDSNGKGIYYEESTGFWWKSEYDSNGNEIYFEKSTGFWFKKQYDSNGNKIYCEDSNGYWSKFEYDSNGNQIYYESSNGDIIDNRPKEVKLTLEDIAKKFNIDVKQINIVEKNPNIIDISNPHFFSRITDPTKIVYRIPVNESPINYKSIIVNTYMDGLPIPKNNEILYKYDDFRGYILKI